MGQPGHQRDWLVAQADECPKHTAQSTLALASVSYLVPWFECLKLSKTTGLEFINALAPELCIDQLGVLADDTFDAWWLGEGFRRMGAGITSVKLIHPSKQNNWQAGFTTQMRLPPEVNQREVLFLMNELRSYEPGRLSSSPLLWHGWKTRLTAPMLSLYLKVFRLVLEQPTAIADRVFRVGEQLNLAPKLKLRSRDTDGERKKKREGITHEASRYFINGKALMINAVLGDFPNIKMPKELVQKRRAARPAHKISKYERWDTGATIRSA